MLTGTETATNLSPHILSFQPDREYVVIHTHPRNTSFSQYDVLIFAEYPTIRVMVGVGVDGIWHLLSRMPDAAITDPRAVFDDCVNERRRLASEQTAVAEISHLATEYVAGRHGLRYDQVMGLRDERPPA